MSNKRYQGKRWGAMVDEYYAELNYNLGVK